MSNEETGLPQNPMATAEIESGAVSLKPVPPAPTTTVVQAPPEPAELTAEELQSYIHKLDRGLVVLAIVFAFFMASFAAHNAPIWMHLASGRLLSAGAYQLGQEPFTYTVADRPWINHSWLFDLATYRLSFLAGGPEQMGGGLLVLIKALLIAAMAAVMISICRPDQSYWIPAVLTGLAAYAMSQRLHLDPICISFLFLAITVAALYRSTRESKGGAGSGFIPVYLLPLLFIVWVNLDEWFILGPITVALFAIGEVLQMVVPGDSQRPTFAVVARLIAVLLLGTAACLLNPFGAKAFQLPTEIWALWNPGNLKTDVWFTSYFYNGVGKDYLVSVSAYTYLALFALGAASFALNFDDIRWWRVTLWVPFFLLSAAISRAVPFFAIVGAPITALNFQDFVVKRFGAVPRVQGNLKNWSLGGRILTMLAGVVVLIAAWPGWLHAASEDAWRTRRVAWKIEPDPSLKQACERIAEFRKSGVIPAGTQGWSFNPDMTAYCAWFCPEEKGYFDLRLPLFGAPESATEKDDKEPLSVQERFYELRQDLNPAKGTAGHTPDWYAKFRDAKISHVVLNHVYHDLVFETMLGELWNQNRDWALLYMDGRTAIFGWKDPENAKASKRFDENRIDVKRLAFNPSAAGEIVAPAQGPEIPQGRGFLAQFLYGPPAHPLAADECLSYLNFYGVQKVKWPRGYFLTQLVTDRLPGIVGVGIGCGPLPLIAANANLLMPPDLMIADQSHGPCAPLLLAIRLARQAIDASPEDAEGYILLAQAYQTLWEDLELPWSRGRADQLKNLRFAQSINALQTALSLQPDSYMLHSLLADLYRKQHYVDCEIDELQDLVQDFQNAGKPRSVSTEQFDQQLRQYEDLLDRRKLETKYDDLRNDFEVAAADRPPIDRVHLAIQRGLMKKAIEILQENDFANLGPSVGQLIVPLKFNTGRAEEIRAADFKLSDWFNVMLAAVRGDYNKADTLLTRFVDDRNDTLRKILMMVRVQTFTPAGMDPTGQMNMSQELLHYYEHPELQMIRGVLALESGHVDEATQALTVGWQQSVQTLNAGHCLAGFAAATPLGSLSLSAAQTSSNLQNLGETSSRPVAAGYLKLLRGAAN
jgi:tetratricopeptide (TPR) repeat protein